MAVVAAAPAVLAVGSPMALAKGTAYLLTAGAGAPDQINYKPRRLNTERMLTLPTAGGTVVVEGNDIEYLTLVTNDIVTIDEGFRNFSSPAGSGLQPAASVFEAPQALLYTPASSGTLMLGLAAQITPKTTGRLEFLVTLGLYVYETDLVAVAVMYGTGTPPVQGAALTGTQVGNAYVDAGSDASLPAGTLDIPLTVVADIQLATGTKYWFDVAIAWGSTHDSVSMAAWSLKEIP